MHFNSTTSWQHRLSLPLAYYEGLVNGNRIPPIRRFGDPRDFEGRIRQAGTHAENDRHAAAKQYPDDYANRRDGVLATCQWLANFSQPITPPGHATVLATPLRDLLKEASKLAPTKKLRKEKGFFRKDDDHYDRFFDRVTLIVEADRLHISLWTIDDDELVPCSLVVSIDANVEQPFQANIDLKTLRGIAKFWSKGRIELVFDRRLDNLHIQQTSNRTRLPHNRDLAQEVAA